MLMMENAEVEENLLSIGEPKVCKWIVVYWIYVDLQLGKFFNLKTLCRLSGDLILSWMIDSMVFSIKLLV